MRTRLTVGTVTVLAALYLATPATAQEDRSSDASFGFAGRAEYNQPPSAASSDPSENGASHIGSHLDDPPSKGGSFSAGGSSGGASSDPASAAGYLPETGGGAVLPAMAVAGLLGSAILIRRAARKSGA